MKKNLYEYSTKNEKFIILCNRIMGIINKKEIGYISKNNFEIAKEKFQKFITPITEIKTNYYIIYDEDHENNELKNSLINYLKEQKITFNAGKGMNIIKEKKRIIINKIMIFFVNDS